MNVNVWGHVKSPGSHLVYEGIDLVNLLSTIETLSVFPSRFKVIFLV